MAERLTQEEIDYFWWEVAHPGAFRCKSTRCMEPVYAVYQYSYGEPESDYCLTHATDLIRTSVAYRDTSRWRILKK